MKLIILFISLLLFIAPGLATDMEAEIVPDQPTCKQSRPFIYQFHKEGETNSSVFLVGTMHTLAASAVSDAIKHLIGSTDILVIELYKTAYLDYPELCDYADVSLETLKSKGYFDQDFSGWLEQLSEKDSKWLYDQIAHDFKAPWGLELAEVPPSIINYIIQQCVERIRASIVGSEISAPENTFDNYIKSLYWEKKIIGLENRKDRLTVSGTLDKLATEDVQTSLKQIQEGIKTVTFLTSKEGEEEWRKHYYSQLSQQIKQRNNAFKDAQDVNVLIPFSGKETVKRNKLWIPRIKDIIKNNPEASMTIMVGGAHLAGKKGLVNLLAQQGCSLKKL
jgi:GumN protein.